MKNRTFPVLLLLAAPLALLSGCKKDSDSPDTGSVNFTVQNVAPTGSAGSTLQPITLNVTSATTAAGETFTVTRFEYYLSNIKFTKSDGTTYAAPDTYYLVDQATAKTLSFTVPNVPAGDYTGVSFIVGVDAQKTGLTDPLTFTGQFEALNPANNMYWSWNSGHIFMKMEASLTSANPAKPLTCHIGGYTGATSAIVTAAPSFGSSKLTVRTDKAPTIALQANVVKLFDGPNPITLSTFTGAHMPGAQSVQIAQNYAAGMFSVTQINAN
ncbi:MAG TPA: MbnP family protein [Hymenobacter sp.]|uniref:MbnP family protein n=1 Tax=Hymenobacter sp. TaxID=1898978 RepID=UPI002D80826A|nr:MbnP family protein [Hymenobacter sp.]HET9505750.1 MbnP family protein [Hymenobacter sp.]